MENNNIGNAERAGKGVEFERIRRITGYLVGTVDRWNDAKKTELNDRVKQNALIKQQRKKLRDLPKKKP